MILNQGSLIPHNIVVLLSFSKYISPNGAHRLNTRHTVHINIADRDQGLFFLLLFYNLPLGAGTSAFRVLGFVEEGKYSPVTLYSLVHGTNCKRNLASVTF